MTSVDVVEVELTPQDQLYYVSRESGDDFSTRPYVMHTALYYAFGLLPSRFRVTEQTPKYQEHFQDSVASDVYIHPAIPSDSVAGNYTTRRFAVKPDKFRDKAEQENKNLKETGFQRFIDPGVKFQTFIRVDDGGAEPLARDLAGYCRIGKKMTATRVRTSVHQAAPKTGAFDLDHPIGNVDISTDEYELRGNVHMESMMPVNVITSAEVSGEYISITPTFGSSQKSVALPTRTEFLSEEA
jgi:CRISPR-associated protein Csc1